MIPSRLYIDFRAPGNLTKQGVAVACIFWQSGQAGRKTTPRTKYEYNNYV
jgi:hypothetical protein